jgi:hypothetical protein
MSSTPDSAFDPSATMRFCFDELRAAGQRLGQIESSLPPPSTTFEELHRRAAEIDRKRRSVMNDRSAYSEGSPLS